MISLEKLLDYFSHIAPFKTMNICPFQKVVAKLCLKFCIIVDKPLKDCHSGKISSNVVALAEGPMCRLKPTSSPEHSLAA